MIEFISSIIAQFGGRVAGSQEERNAQLYFKSLLEPFCDSVEFHEFQAAISSKFHSLKAFCLVFVLALVVFQFNVLLATLLALFNSSLFILHFILSFEILDFLYKKKKSCNVIGTIEPEQEATSTLLIAGHMDSVYEFQWWYKLEKTGALLTGISGFLIAIQGIVFLIAAAFFLGFGRLPFVFQIIWGIQLLFTPALITFYAMHGKIKVDGAMDNLTGVALAYEMGKHFSSNHKLQHTRLKIISFGSEECGLRGSKNYVKDHIEELQSQKTHVINVDSIKNKALLTILEEELMARVIYDENMTATMEQAFQNCGVPFHKIKLAIGATDGAAFAAQEIPATSIIGMSTKEFEPTYHTRLDTIENVDPEGIETMKTILIRLIEDWDKH
jgi:acetylornithine deacetylase/succinyl-diaminopimelate desuccinylase-like protein